MTNTSRVCDREVQAIKEIEIGAVPFYGSRLVVSHPTNRKIPSSVRADRSTFGGNNSIHM